MMMMIMKSVGVAAIASLFSWHLYEFLNWNHSGGKYPDHWSVCIIVQALLWPKSALQYVLQSPLYRATVTYCHSIVLCGIHYIHIHVHVILQILQGHSIVSSLQFIFHWSILTGAQHVHCLGDT